MCRSSSHSSRGRIGPSHCEIEIINGVWRCLTSVQGWVLRCTSCRGRVRAEQQKHSLIYTRIWLPTSNHGTPRSATDLPLRVRPVSCNACGWAGQPDMSLGFDVPSRPTVKPNCPLSFQAWRLDHGSCVSTFRINSCGEPSRAGAVRLNADWPWLLSSRRNGQSGLLKTAVVPLTPLS